MKEKEKRNKEKRNKENWKGFAKKKSGKDMKRSITELKKKQ